MTKILSILWDRNFKSHYPKNLFIYLYLNNKITRKSRGLQKYVYLYRRTLKYHQINIFKIKKRIILLNRLYTLIFDNT